MINKQLQLKMTCELKEKIGNGNNLIISTESDLFNNQKGQRYGIFTLVQFEQQQQKLRKIGFQ